MTRKNNWLVLALLLLLSGRKVLAQDFQTEVIGQYTFGEADKAKVQLDFTLTNTTPTLFVSNYQITIPEAGVSGVVLQQKDEEITRQTNSQDGQQVWDLVFENQVVGQGKKRQFSLEYQDSNLMQTRGQSKLINIPPPAGSEAWDDYQVRLTVPTAFGQADKITPTPTASDSATTGLITYTFSDIGQQTINLAFGQQQHLQWSATQTLANHSNAPAYREVVFPGETDQLETIFTHLYPTPVEWKANEDGSWTGYYLLGIGEQVTVLADGYFIYDQIDKDLMIDEIFPALTSEMAVWNINDIPTEWQKSPQPSVAISAGVVTRGWLPLLNQYQVQVHNRSGYFWSDINWTVHSDDENIIIEPTQTTLSLWPWQKTVIILHVRDKRWWRFYSKFVLHGQLIDETGNIIDQTTIEGLTLSYRAFALVGGVCATAGVAWSILVAGRTKKGHLRRQSKKPQKQT